MIKQYWLHFVIGLLGYFVGYFHGKKNGVHIHHSVREVQLTDEQAKDFMKMLGALSDEVDNSNRTEDKEK